MFHGTFESQRYERAAITDSWAGSSQSGGLKNGGLANISRDLIDIPQGLCIRLLVTDLRTMTPPCSNSEMQSLMPAALNAPRKSMRSSNTA